MFKRARNAEDADGDREVAKDVEHAPGAAATAKFKHRFDQRHATAELHAGADVVEHALGPVVAVRKRGFAAALDVEIEIDRDQSPSGPSRMRGKFTIADEITDNHRIGLRLKNVGHVASSAGLATHAGLVSGATQGS